MGLSDVGGGVGEAAGTILGWNMSADQRKREADEREAALQEQMGVKAPTLSPVQDAYAGIGADPQAKAAQYDALRSLMDVGHAGGMDLQSQAAQNQGLAAANQQGAAREGAIRQHMASMGKGGGGADLAASLQGEQTAATGNALAGSQYASDSRTRALHALAEGGQMGGQIRGQDFAEKAAKAEAANKIALYNKGQLPQQNFMNQENVAKLHAGAEYTDADWQREQMERLMRLYGGVGRAVGGSVGGVGDVANANTGTAAKVASFGG